MSPARNRILLALTSHGLGHLTRSLAVGRELRALHPQVELAVATTVPEARVARDLPPPFRLRHVDYEPGTVQRSCFELDVAATRRAYERFLAERPDRLRAEIEFLREAGIGAVVSDVPALPVRAAAAVGIPAIGLANFTWDWILEPLFAGSALSHVPELLASDYAEGTAHLVLPFGPDASPFPLAEPAPLVSRSARLDAGSLRERLGLPREEAAPLVVVCPGGWEADGWSEIRIRGCEGLRFVTVGDLPVVATGAPLLALSHDLVPGVEFPDLVAAASAVVAKPGYGIASECAVHGTALVAIERPGFRETPVLVDAFRKRGRLAELSLADFFAGRWEEALGEVLAARRPEHVPPRQDGAGRVARRLVELLEL